MILKLKLILAAAITIVCLVAIAVITLHFGLPKTQTTGLTTSHAKKDRTDGTEQENKLISETDAIFKGVVDTQTKHGHLIGNLTKHVHLSNRHHDERIHKISESHTDTRHGIYAGTVIVVVGILGTATITAYKMRVNGQQANGQQVNGQVMEHINVAHPEIELFPHVALDEQH